MPKRKEPADPDELYRGDKVKCRITGTKGIIHVLLENGLIIIAEDGEEFFNPYNVEKLN